MIRRLAPLAPVGLAAALAAYLLGAARPTWMALLFAGVLWQVARSTRLRAPAGCLAAALLGVASALDARAVVELPLREALAAGLLAFTAALVAMAADAHADADPG